MKAIALVTVAVAGFMSMPPAHAAHGFYVGANFSSVTYDEDPFESAKPTTLGFKFGKEINKNLAVEGRIGFGIGDDTINVFGTPVDIEIDNYYGAYAKGILPLSPTFSLYGLVGYTHAKISASGGGVSASDSDSDISFGFGGDIAVGANAAINVEWAKLLEGTGYEVEALTVGFSLKF